MNEIKITITVEINPTEEPEKVKQAVKNIFGAINFKIEPLASRQILKVEARGIEHLTKLQNMLKREQIRSAARKVFKSGLNESSLTFYLNKQVAYAEHLSFSQETAESPLGPIKIQIHTSDPRKLIDWLAPKINRKSRSPPRRPK